MLSISDSLKKESLAQELTSLVTLKAPHCECHENILVWYFYFNNDSLFPNLLFSHLSRPWITLSNWYFSQLFDIDHIALHKIKSLEIRAVIQLHLIYLIWYEASKCSVNEVLCRKFQNLCGPEPQHDEHTQNSSALTLQTGTSLIEWPFCDNTQHKFPVKYSNVPFCSDKMWKRPRKMNTCNF